MKKYIIDDKVFNATIIDKNTETPIMIFENVPLLEPINLNEQDNIYINLDLDLDVLQEIKNTLEQPDTIFVMVE